MDYRQLLEAAARAAGLEVQHMALSGFSIVSGPDAGKVWNPLEDDGDALRLSAKLHIDIEWQATSPFPVAEVEAYQRDPDADSYFCASEPETGYRRAIVRAAAALCGPEGEHNG